MRRDVRQSTNRRAGVRYKLSLASCLFSLVMISLVGGVSTGARTNQTAKLVPAGAQSDGASSGASPNQTQKPDWRAIDNAVVEQLSVNDLGKIVKSLPESPSVRDAAELMRQLNLFVRAGYRRRVAKVIEYLPEGDDEKYENDLSSIVEFLMRHGELDLTRRLLERFPHIRPVEGFALIQRWAKKGDPNEIDKWLAARMEDNYDYRPPPGRRSSSSFWGMESSYDYWLYLRLRSSPRKETAREMLDSLANDVKAHPTDLTRAYRYLNAVSGPKEEVDLDWMGDTCKPVLAFECYQLGTGLESQSPRAAIALFERALSLPFTNQDKKLLHENIISKLANNFEFLDWEKAWRGWTKLELARSYKADDQVNKAQPIIEELAAAYPDGVPDLGLSKFAGQVQALSGARVIENRIEKAEYKNTDSLEYWRTRAEYYAGRNENARAIEAYERALALAPFVINVVEGTEYYGPRLGILLSFVNFLGGPAKSSEAKQMLWDEFRRTPLDSAYTKLVAQSMVNMEGGYNMLFGVDGSRLWDYLAAQREWGSTEKALLEGMAHRLTTAGLEALWDRAEKLATGGSPTRPYVLGTVMIRREAYLRAIPPLKDAVRRLSTDLEKSSARSDLYQAYINTNDWKAAEEMWPSFRGESRTGPGPGTLGQIAVAAARAQSLDEAMRFWRAKANLDRGDFTYLSDLAQLGLKERLRNFYQQMANDDPESWAPRAALQLLQ